MGEDEPVNGSRYVTHQRLYDLMDAHRRDESAARRAITSRLDAVESVIDQLRGARALIVALIGTNLIVTVITVASWAR